MSLGEWLLLYAGRLLSFIERLLVKRFALPAGLGSLNPYSKPFEVTELITILIDKCGGVEA